MTAIGDIVTLRQDKHAWYSGYAQWPIRVISAGEPLTVTHVGVVPVYGPGTYCVAETAAATSARVSPARD
jgi:hypothetical protein